MIFLRNALRDSDCNDRFLSTILIFPWREVANVGVGGAGIARRGDAGGGGAGGTGDGGGCCSVT